MERKRKVLSLETKYDVSWEIAKGSKIKTKIAKYFQIPKSTLLGIVSKIEINDKSFLYQMLFKMADFGKQTVRYM
jgi:hypothetical protein